MNQPDTQWKHEQKVALGTAIVMIAVLAAAGDVKGILIFAVGISSGLLWGWVTS